MPQPHHQTYQPLKLTLVCKNLQALQRASGQGGIKTAGHEPVELKQRAFLHVQGVEGCGNGIMQVMTKVEGSGAL